MATALICPGSGPQSLSICQGRNASGLGYTCPVFPSRASLSCSAGKVLAWSAGSLKPERHPCI